jgi:hypothetical protein
MSDRPGTVGALVAGGKGLLAWTKATAHATNDLSARPGNPARHLNLIATAPGSGANVAATERTSVHRAKSNSAALRGTYSAAMEQT